MGLPRLYYTLPELAEKWGKSENDLLHLAAARALRLSVQHYGPGYRACGCGPNEYQEIIIEGYVSLNSDDCKSILEFGCEAFAQCIRSVFWEGEHLTIVDVYADEKHMIQFTLDHLKITGPERIFKLHEMEVARGLNKLHPFRALYIPNTSYLLILPDEVARAEAKFSDLAGRNAAAVEAVDQAHEETIGQVGREQACGGTDIVQLFNAHVRRRKPYTQKQVIRILRDNNILPESLGRSDRKPLQAYKDDIIRIAKAHKE